MLKHQDDDIPLFVYVFIRAFIDDCERGHDTMKTLDILLDRIYGKVARQQIIQLGADLNFHPTKEDRAQRLKEIEDKLQLVSPVEQVQYEVVNV